MNLPEVVVGDMTEVKRFTLTIGQKYLVTVLTFRVISGKGLWLMKLIPCHMDYLTNEQVEIHP